MVFKLQDEENLIEHRHDEGQYSPNDEANCLEYIFFIIEEKGLKFLNTMLEKLNFYD